MSESLFSRRRFLTASATIAAGTLVGAPGIVRAAAPHILPPLPYADSALEPVISAKTIGFHYGKHHKAYVDNLNKLVAGTDMADMSLEKVIFGFFVILACTLNFGFFVGEIDSPNFSQK